MDDPSKKPREEVVDTRQQRDGVMTGMKHKGLKMGNGVNAPFTSEIAKIRAEEGREAAIVRKNRRRAEYEDKVGAALENIANLQSSIIDLANDPDSRATKEHMEKLRLGLTASEQILNRVLGKPVTQVEANVTHSVVDEMAELAAEWVVEDAAD